MTNLDLDDDADPRIQLVRTASSQMTSSTRPNAFAGTTGSSSPGRTGDHLVELDPRRRRDRALSHIEGDPKGVSIRNFDCLITIETCDPVPASRYRRREYKIRDRQELAATVHRPPARGIRQVHLTLAILLAMSSCLPIGSESR